jgi:hypothetical protein
MNAENAVTAPTTEGIPHDLINERLVNTYEYVNVSAKRQNDRGQWAMLCKNTQYEPMELHKLDATIEDRYGGGQFHIEVNAPDTFKNLLRFKFRIEGIPKMPKPLAGLPTGTSPHGASGLMGIGMPTSSFNSDEVAMAQLQKKEDELKEAHEARKKLEKQLLDQQQQILKIEAKRESDKRESEVAALRAEMHALKNAPAPVSKPVDWLGIAAVAAPIVTGMFALLQDSRKTEAETQRAMLAQQQQAQQQLMLALTTPKPGFDLKEAIALGTTVLPLLKDFMDGKREDPTKMAEVLASMNESSMGMLSMVSEFLDRHASETPENPWLKVAQQGVEQLITVSQQIMRKKPELPAGPAVALAKPAQNAQQMTVEQVVEAIMRSPHYPQDMQTKEWHEVLLKLHERQSPDAIALLLQAIFDKRESIPEVFKHFWESDGDAHTVIAPLLGQLPIAERDPDYIKAVYEAFDVLYRPDGSETEIVDTAGEAAEEVASAL